MAVVFIPTLLRPLSGGVDRVEASGQSVRDVIENLESLYPGMRDRLMDGGRLRPNVSVAVDGEVCPMGALEPVGPASEIHFVTAISGG
ncbi:MAG: MoaD/ThiS family protein [Acidobacteria bacterium]|nr:MoaD/ThiS family protein [Acidobacteriota bacterium]